MPSKRKHGLNPVVELTGELDPQVWDVEISFAKGPLSKSRYTTVRVIHRPSKRIREASFYGAGKAAARREAAALIRRFVG